MEYTDRYAFHLNNLTNSQCHSQHDRDEFQS